MRPLLHSRFILHNKIYLHTNLDFFEFIRLKKIWNENGLIVVI